MNVFRKVPHIENFNPLISYTLPCKEISLWDLDERSRNGLRFLKVIIVL
jgi:hypothetical protein